MARQERNEYAPRPPRVNSIPEPPPIDDENDVCIKCDGIGHIVVKCESCGGTGRTE